MLEVRDSLGTSPERCSSTSGAVATAGSELRHLGETGAPRELLSGWACRAQDGPSAHKQVIYSFILPGDVFGTGASVRGDYRILSLTRSESRPLWSSPEDDARGRRVVERICEAQEERLLRSSIRRLSTLGVHQRVADMLCELEARLRAVGLSDGLSFALPIRLRDLGSSVGATPSQVTRALQALHSDGVLAFGAGRVVIRSRKALEDLIGRPARKRSWPVLDDGALPQLHG